MQVQSLAGGTKTSYAVGCDPKVKKKKVVRNGQSDAYIAQSIIHWALMSPGWASFVFVFIISYFQISPMTEETGVWRKEWISHLGYVLLLWVNRISSYPTMGGEMRKIMQTRSLWDIWIKLFFFHINSHEVKEAGSPRLTRQRLPCSEGSLSQINISLEAWWVWIVLWECLMLQPVRKANRCWQLSPPHSSLIKYPILFSPA